MEQEASGGSRIIHHELSLELGREVAEPADELNTRFLDLVANRDEESLARLILEEQPTVLWGNLFNQLSEDNRAWVYSVLYQS